jgi:hypothetical protein
VLVRLEPQEGVPADLPIVEDTTRRKETQ